MMDAVADNTTSSQPMPMSDKSSIPSIALQITRKNGDRFLEACATLKECLDRPNYDDERDSRQLHERVFTALLSQECSSHPMLSQFLERMQMSNLTAKEKKAATLLFHESDKSVKLGHFFTALSHNNEKQLARSGLLSLFRTILTAITLSLQMTDYMQDNSEKSFIVEGQPSKSSSPERPSKRSKLHHGDNTVSTQDETEEDESRIPCQSPSWDSSLATLRDEDDHSGLKKEIQDVATYAADDLLNFAAKNSKSPSLEETSVDFALFSSWYNADGGVIIPWIELLQLSKWKAPSKNVPKQISETTGSANDTNDESSPGSLMAEDDKSRTLVSFDFTDVGSPSSMLVNISEDNLVALQELVHRTQLIQRSASDVCKLLLQGGTVRSTNTGKELLTLRKEDFRRLLRSIIPDYVYTQLKPGEETAFHQSFDDFFVWFEDRKFGLHEGEVNLKEFAVGFSFFCAGNKSTKLATGFELLDNKNRGYLTEDQLLRYLQSYLTMLVGMSLLRPVNKINSNRPLTREKRKTMREAIENGAKWTLGHFLRASGQTKNEYTFEKFASWYSEGGYNTAPWLELLDLGKVMSLIGEAGSPIALPPVETSKVLQTTERRPRVRDRVSSLRRHHLAKTGLPPEILFTFPLGNRRSLVVLKDDATYVRAVVEKLGLLSMKPDDLWSALSSAVEKRRPPTSPSEVAIYVNMDTFVQSMQDVCPVSSRKRPNQDRPMYHISSSVDELLSNFFLCFDIDQCDSVALDELMGGLTLLCGGKKSHKLAFAFSIFDTRPGVSGRGKKRGVVHSLSGEDLFLFLRSILIVTFSTCRQSLDLTDEMVSRCIADTANMICNDVMRHQWETKRLDRLNFDEFGQWYNDGGFERAPWLELLDLRKWVLIDDLQPPNNQIHRVAPAQSESIATIPSRELPILPAVPAIPPPPPEDVLDTNFFDTDALMPMDSVRLANLHSY
jgi:Ca2+-binding EF-hand superfamily protein